MFEIPRFPTHVLSKLYESIFNVMIKISHNFTNVIYGWYLKDLDLGEVPPVQLSVEVFRPRVTVL